MALLNVYHVYMACAGPRFESHLCYVEPRQLLGLIFIRYYPVPRKRKKKQSQNKQTVNRGFRSKNEGIWYVFLTTSLTYIPAVNT